MKIERNILSWALGITGVVVFVLCIVIALMTGQLLRDAHDLIKEQPSRAEAAFQQLVVNQCQNPAAAPAYCPSDEQTLKQVLNTCISATANEGRLPYGACHSLWTTALLAIDITARGGTYPGNTFQGSIAQGSTAQSPATRESSTSQSAALNAAGIPATISNVFTGIGRFFSPDPAKLARDVHVSIAPLFFFATAGIATLVIGLGLGSTGLWYGALVNPQNRMSLSLVQIFSWTALIIPAYAVMAAFNTGLSPPEGVAVFPEVPGWAWAVLGITFASPMVSSLINASKPHAGEGKKPVQLTALKGFNVALAPLQQRYHARFASVADLFFGEDVDNDHRLDVTRTQNVLFTLVLLLIYGGGLYALMGDISPSAVISSLSGSTPIALFASLPNPGGSFVGLLGLTHGAYIAGKVQKADANIPAGSSPPPATSGASTPSAPSASSPPSATSSASTPSAPPGSSPLSQPPTASASGREALDPDRSDVAGDGSEAR